ncbi:MAG: ATP-dependent DNA helicase RecG [Chthoniobacterales bacterium]|nr:ATP-dependent DNA helicase RecG [Chthoniobacterales bacterium]
MSGTEGTAPAAEMLRWQTPLCELGQIAAARLKALNEAGLGTVGDLLRHYPRRHEDRTKFPGFPADPPEAAVCLRGIVAETKMIRFGQRCQFLLTLTEPSGGAAVRCRWFNLRYLPKILQAGQDLVIHGRARAMKKGGLVFDHPDFEVLETDAPDSALIHLNRIAPVYPSLGPWSPRALRRLIYETLARLDNGSVPSPGAGPIRAIHFPASLHDLETSRVSLAHEELFEMQCVLARQRSRQSAGSAPVIARRSVLLTRFVKDLPFSLTLAQKRVLAQIFDDLARGHPMNRLLHGDVGSGKTIVAATAMLGAIAAGHSAALMAPTQVLAQQHHENFRRLLEPLGIPVILRTATRKEKTTASGPRIVIGTHALLFSPETLGNPALVVIDEQHKFGVRQRAKLSAQSPHPHVLVMSATPIPRTLALTLYGDLDISLLDELPPGRTPVRTLVRPHEKLSEAAEFLRKQLDEGRQAYLVYPVIEEGKRKELKAATTEFDKWEKLLAPHGCALLHGRMDAEEKDEVMKNFRGGATRALVSTTVIEVGIDVANATVLLVENAERFGLAQLHQLRGRVGRGSEKSWCVLLAGKDAEEKLDRLKLLEKASDGFTIAEADLELRGPGDLLGTDQTGLPPVRLAKLPRDLPLLEKARAEAQQLMADDPALLSRPDLQSRLALWEKRLFAGIA